MSRLSIVFFNDSYEPVVKLDWIFKEKRADPWFDGLLVVDTVLDGGYCYGDAAT